jgi:hypothetical protein
VPLLLLAICAPVPANERPSGLLDGTANARSLSDLTAGSDGELDELLRPCVLRLAGGPAPLRIGREARRSGTGPSDAPWPASWQGRRPSTERAPPAGNSRARYTPGTIGRSPGHTLAPEFHPFSVTATLRQRSQIPPDYRPA